MIIQRTLETETGRYLYREYGSGPDVLLLHGWLNSSRLWESTLLHLGKRYHAVALDLAGFGGSDIHGHDGPLSVDHQLKFVRDFCATLNLRPFSVVGHSMGGALTLKLSLEHPELMEKMVLVCPVIVGKLYAHQRFFINTLLNPRTYDLGRRAWPVVQSIPSGLSMFAGKTAPAQAIRRNFEDFKRATWKAAHGGASSMLDIRLDRRLHEVNTPTFVVIAGKDETVPPGEARLAAQQIRGAQSLEFTEAHHHVFDEHPEQFHNALDQFLATD